MFNIQIIKREKYDFSVDWWSLGILTYELLTGTVPFYGNNDRELYLAILKKEPTYPSYLSDPAKGLLKSMLEKQPAMRLGSSESPHGAFKDSEFFRDVDWHSFKKKRVEAPFKPKIVKI